MSASSFSDDEVLGLLQNLSLDELYERLASSLPGNEGFGSNAVAKGKATFSSLQARLRLHLCPRLQEPGVSVLIDSPVSSDTISLVAVIASIIDELGILLNATLVAVLIIRLGVRRICPMGANS